MINEETDLRPRYYYPCICIYSSLTMCVNIRSKENSLEKLWIKKGKKVKTYYRVQPCWHCRAVSSCFRGKWASPPFPLSSATYFLRMRTACLERKRASERERASKAGKKFCANNAKNSGWLRRMLSKRRAAAKIPVYPYCHPTVELLHYYTPHVRDSSHRNGKTSSPILPLIIIRTSGHYGFLKRAENVIIR